MMFSPQMGVGLASARGWLWALGLAMGTAIPLLAWWQSVGDLRVYIDYQTPPGQLLYVLSKLAGLYALFLGWLQILFVLLKHSVAGGLGRRWSLAFHRALGLTVLGCMTLHALLFITAASLRTGHVAFGLLAPNFSGFYAIAVTLGLFGLYGMIIVALAGLLRAAGYSRAIGWHYAAIPVFVCAYLHSLLIGTETRASLLLALYTLMGVTLLAACMHRLSRFRATSVAN